ncbi:unnamed protein product [Prunus brigantina]
MGDPAISPDHVLVEDVTEVDGGVILRPNPATSLKFQQFMRDMETMAQTMASKNAQIKERPYPEHFDQEEFPRGFKVPNFALSSGDWLSRPSNILADSQPNVQRLGIVRP